MGQSLALSDLFLPNWGVLLLGVVHGGRRKGGTASLRDTRSYSSVTLTFSCHTDSGIVQPHILPVVMTFERYAVWVLLEKSIRDELRLSWEAAGGGQIRQVSAAFN